jgi:O-antigen ligase/polysaccharide polymerase Wzy-like membrane protein
MLVGGSVVLALFAPPRIAKRSTRWLDASLVVTVAAIGVQLVPLAPATRNALDPAAEAFDRVMRVGASTVDTVRRPISIDPPATVVAIIVFAASVLAFWAMRTVLHRGGLRFLSRALAMVGLAATLLAVANHLALVPQLDAVWPRTHRDLHPWGPFFNRNDFASWLLMTLALALGYAVARLQARHHHGEPLDPDRAFDRTGTWLAVSICVMVGGIMASLSRSGMLGLLVAVVLFSGAGQGRLSATRTRGLVIALAALLAAGALFANFGALSERLAVTFSEGMTGRTSIWRQTWPVVRDFWPVGTGVGTYRRAMDLYQTSLRLITIAHADNEPLQILAEGGALVGVPMLAAVLAAIVLIAKRLREDRSAMFWVRAGAASGVAGIAVQNLVEMTLRVPVNALLFAILAAVALHEPPTRLR